MEERDLVDRAAEGDEGAFTALMRTTTPSVRVVVRSFVSDPHEIEDLVQETYLRALTALPKLENHDRFRPWLYTIARNIGRDHDRRRRRRQTSPTDEFDVEPTDDGPTAEETAEVRELAESVHIAIGQLSPQDATLLAMVTALGFTPLDVADALGMSHTAAKVALHRARKRLRQALALEEAVALPGRGCATFHRLTSSGELVDAALHARSCQPCQARPSTR